MVNSAYSITAAKQMEHQLQPLVDLLLERIATLGDNGQRSVDAAALLSYYSFDVVGQVNISKPVGFLETVSDVDDNISSIAMINTYFSVVGQAPWMHKLLLGNRIMQRFMEPNNTTQNLAIQFLQEGMSRDTGNRTDDTGKDFMARFLDFSAKNPSKLTGDEIVALTTTNILAGFTTVAIGLSSIVYYLSRNQDAYLKLQQEIDQAFGSANLTGAAQPLPYAQVATLPYLNATVVEALRMHPATGLVLQREVPAGGAILAGKHVPGGTIVGINSWVMHANTQVYGADAHVFRPERWLVADAAQLSEMKRCNMTVSSNAAKNSLTSPSWLCCLHSSCEFSG